jgi:hypothetical protein
MNVELKIIKVGSHHFDLTMKVEKCARQQW